MEINLSKRDIIHLLRGVEVPDYKTLCELRDVGLVEYMGGFVDNFEWKGIDRAIWDEYSEEELYELYIKLTKD